MIRSTAILVAALLLSGALPALCCPCGELPAAGVAAPPCHESSVHPGGDCCAASAATAPPATAAVDPLPLPVPAPTPAIVALNATAPLGTVRTLHPPAAAGAPLLSLLSTLRL